MIFESAGGPALSTGHLLKASPRTLRAVVRGIHRCPHHPIDLIGAIDIVFSAERESKSMDPRLLFATIVATPCRPETVRFRPMFGLFKWGSSLKTLSTKQRQTTVCPSAILLPGIKTCVLDRANLREKTALASMKCLDGLPVPVFLSTGGSDQANSERERRSSSSRDHCPEKNGYANVQPAVNRQPGYRRMHSQSGSTCKLYTKTQTIKKNKKEQLHPTKPMRTKKSSKKPTNKHGKLRMQSMYGI